METQNILNAVGLTLDIIGVVGLYHYGLIPDKFLEHLDMDMGFPLEKAKRYVKYSKVALVIIVIGFGLQILAAFYSSIPCCHN